MNLPDIRNDNVAWFLDSAAVVQETAEQIMKDFAMFGITITFSGNTDQAYRELHEQLVDQIRHLLANDYQRLLSVLYQVDITQREITQAGLDLPDYNEMEVLAHQIIVRDLKKVLTRRYFKSQG
ncbi:hypothetical protein [Prolixibacter denitrificans]|uniref:Uncharacterized protein n=1 Tax=Prolixibacter denitrificans TaxID=1541063 RepID=A0A2P8C7I7_9BACT|nr:hypothetical protein [Prolixibacter denitrificans]PSK80925.1 hypothetical protein CLV93_11260 [Prolixibacter denitrificans]GET22329.1 hypothetical protein JCM18694_25750 [Prolixibacter denitrificans]